ncbi:MAG: response regulator [Bdellovibrionales bacterium]|nr:response regulator [Bdellovibrionales bacterium]NQZ19073.1 response regulator [Bdellovibrionales bacterium]
MTKIMLVIDNDAERDFLEKVLERLQYEVISMTKGSVLAEQLLDHFPDVVFASTLGKNQKILTALSKIKQARGKPKVVFVRQERESSPLNADQKKVIDSVIYSPIDPFKLIDVLSQVTNRSLQELRTLYNEMLQKDKPNKVTDVSDDVVEQIDADVNPKEDLSPTPDSRVFGLGGVKINTNTDGSKVITKGGGVSVNKSESGVLIIDYKRKEKYQQIVDQLKTENQTLPQEFDSKKLRDLQKEQSKNVSEDEDVKKNRKHFLKTLFTMDPKDSK